MQVYWYAFSDSKDTNAVKVIYYRYRNAKQYKSYRHAFALLKHIRDLHKVICSKVHVPYCIGALMPLFQ